MDEYSRILDNARETWMREKDLPPIAVPSIPRAVLLAQATNALQGSGAAVGSNILRSTLCDGFKPFSCEPALGLKTSRGNDDLPLLSILLLFPSSWHPGDACPQSAPSMLVYLHTPFQPHPNPWGRMVLLRTTSLPG